MTIIHVQMLFSTLHVLQSKVSRHVYLHSINLPQRSSLLVTECCHCQVLHAETLGSMSRPSNCYAIIDLFSNIFVLFSSPRSSGEQKKKRKEDSG